MKKGIEGLQIAIRKSEEILHQIIQKLTIRDTILKEEDVSCLLLYRKTIEKMDGIFILADHGHLNTMNSIARDLFENHVYLLFMLQERYRYRAKAYQFQAFQENLNLINWHDPSKNIGKKLSPYLNASKLPLPKDLLDKKEYILKRLQEDSEFKSISVDWKRKRKEGQHPSWYNIGGGKDSIAALCRYLEIEEQYKTVYSIFSSETHSTNGLNQILYEDGEVILSPIRGMDIDKNIALDYSTTTGLSSTFEVTKHFDEELAMELGDWYLHNFKKEIISERQNSD